MIATNSKTHVQLGELGACFHEAHTATVQGLVLPLQPQLRVGGGAGGEALLVLGQDQLWGKGRVL